jgi:hypothetical protein
MECLVIDVDAGIADVALPVVENVLRGVLKNGLVGVILEIEFVKGVAYLHERHKLTGRLYGTKVKLAPNSCLLYDGIEFRFEPFSPFMIAQKTMTYLYARLLTDQINLQQFQQLLDLLFERQILFFHSAIGS